MQCCETIRLTRAIASKDQLSLPRLMLEVDEAAEVVDVETSQHLTQILSCRDQVGSVAG